MFLFVISVVATSLTMTQGFPESPVPSGTSVSLICGTGSGNPTPDITWWRSSELVTDGDVYTVTSEEIPGDFNAQGRRSTLSFTAKHADSGMTFECRMDGASISSSKRFHSKSLRS